MSCPKCGSESIEVRREDAGFVRTRNGTRREHRTVCFCKKCGYTWTTSGPELKKKRPWYKSPLVIALAVIFVIGGIGNAVSPKMTPVKYEVTEDNIVLVTNPSEEYIVSRLSKVDGIIEVEAATREQNPNSLFSKENGATSVVYFSYDKIDQGKIQGDTVVDKGTECGGCVEVYKTPEDAEARRRYLAGLSLLSGSQKAIGTVVIRTSPSLKSDEQDYLESLICSALLGSDEK